MIVTRLLGGLGNQMFQYAVGRALAVRCGVGLLLDTRAFDDYPLRSYALRQLAIEGDELTDAQCKELGLANLDAGRLRLLLAQWIGNTRLTTIREKSYEFDVSVLNAPSACYLMGYWQSPKYFAAIDDEIRREFSVRAPLVGENLEVSRSIGNCRAVSVHVRRGDYVSNPLTNRYHGTCDPDYYMAAEAQIRQRLDQPTLFVFSDDPEWAAQNLRFQSPTVIVRHNGPERDCEDLRLMTLCKHHIIANSTFSWWGAWLSANPCKIVVAPRNWFRDASQTTADLIPEDWIRV